MNYHLSIEAEEGSLYYERFTEAFPVPRVGEDVVVGALGWWTVETVDWSIPSMQAMAPGWWVTLRVKWSDNNKRPKPHYDEEEGWK